MILLLVQSIFVDFDKKQFIFQKSMEQQKMKRKKKRNIIEISQQIGSLKSTNWLRMFKH